MKKILFLCLVFSAVVTTSAYAQPSAQAQPNAQAKPSAQSQSVPPAVDQAAMLQKMKEMFKAPMVEKTGLTEAQVDKVLEINLDIRIEASKVLPGLNDSDRTQKLAEIKAEKEKRYAAIPLTQDQIKSVYAFYEDLAKNRN